MVYPQRIYTTYMEENTCSYTFKILVVGDCNSGKTLFLKRITKNKFKVTYSTNLGDVTLKFLEVPGVVSSDNEYYSSNDAVIFFSSVNNYSLTDNKCSSWIRSVYDRCGVIPYFFVYSGMDLLTSDGVKKFIERTSKSKYNSFTYYISSKSGSNIIHFLNNIIKTLTNNNNINILLKHE